MELPLMRFEGFEWPRNPYKLNVINRNETRWESFPQKGETLTGCMRKCSVVSGEGEFLGEDCVTQYEKLKAVFKKHKRGVLTLPNGETLRVCFEELSSHPDSTPKKLSYSFRFSEESSVPHNLSKSSEYVAAGGESLFDIAYAEDVDIDTLVRVNPQIRDIREIKKGERVRLC